MKLTLQFKTPDVIDMQTIREDIAFECKCHAETDCELCDQVDKKVTDMLEKYIKYGEAIRIEFDTDTGSAIVIEV